VVLFLFITVLFVPYRTGGPVFTLLSMP